MTLTTFILVLLCVLAGHSLGRLQDYALLQINVTALKASYKTNTGSDLLIHDAYNIFMENSCAGYYSPGNVLPLRDVSCTKATPNARTLPSHLILADLLADPSNQQNLTCIGSPREIDRHFKEHYNPQLYAALVFHILSLVVWGGAVCVGFLACGFGAIGSADTFLLIASIILTITESQATFLINDTGSPLITASYNSKFLYLTWVAYALNLVAIFVWSLAASVSIAYRAEKL